MLSILSIKEFFLRKNTPLQKKYIKIILLVFLFVLLFLKIHDNPVFRRFLADREFDGDERKYMRIVQSLAEDGDLDLSNLWYKEEEIEKAREEMLSSGSRKVDDLYFLGMNGGIYTLHMPGIAFLILPAYKLDSIFYPNDPESAPAALPFLPLKLYFTHAFLAALTVMNFLLLMRLLSRTLCSFLLAFVLSLLLIYNSSFLHYSFTVFPGCAATFFCLLALNSIFFPFKNKYITDLLLSVGIVFLPWLHQRFIPLSAGLFLAFFFYRKKAGISVNRFFSVCLMIIILSLPYFYYFYSLTGSPSPLSTSRLFGTIHISARVISVGFFGLIFSPSQGYIWNYPWIFLCFFGSYWGLKEDKKTTFVLTLIIILYYLTCSASINLGGGGYPVGRFLLPLLPLFLIFAGKTLQNFYRKFSYSKLIFYFAFFLLFFLNKEFLLRHFSDRHVQPPYSLIYMTEPHSLIWIAQSICVILFFYLSISLSDRFLFAKEERKKSLGTNNGIRGQS